MFFTNFLSNKQERVVLDTNVLKEVVKRKRTTLRIGNLVYLFGRNTLHKLDRTNGELSRLEDPPIPITGKKAFTLGKGEGKRIYIFPGAYASPTENRLLSFDPHMERWTIN